MRQLQVKESQNNESFQWRIREAIKKQPMSVRSVALLINASTTAVSDATSLMPDIYEEDDGRLFIIGNYKNGGFKNG